MTAGVGARPPVRYVEIELDGAYEGWHCRALADFPAFRLADLQSGDMVRVLDALSIIVTEHNFPQTDGTLAPELGLVDPYGGLTAAATAIFEEIARLPNR